MESIRWFFCGSIELIFFPTKWGRENHTKAISEGSCSPQWFEFTTFFIPVVHGDISPEIRIA